MTRHRGTKRIRRELGSQYCLSAMLARPYDEAGNADSTIAVIERYLAITPGARMEASTGSGAVNLPTGKGPSRVTRTSIVL